LRANKTGASARANKNGARVQPTQGTGDMLAPDARANEGQQGPEGFFGCWPSAPPPLRGGPRGQQTPENRILVFDVEGDPRPEPRPRFSYKTRHVYVPSSAHEWKRAIRAGAAAAIERDGFNSDNLTRSALGVVVLFRLARPKSHLRTGRYAGKIKANALEHHPTKPDIDNLLKAVMDALGVFDGCPALVWRDDAQVALAHARKRYVAEGEVPGASVAVFELERIP